MKRYLLFGGSDYYVDAQTGETVNEEGVAA